MTDASVWFAGMGLRARDHNVQPPGVGLRDDARPSRTEKEEAGELRNTLTDLGLGQPFGISGTQLAEECQQFTDVASFPRHTSPSGNSGGSEQRPDRHGSRQGSKAAG